MLSRCRRVLFPFSALISCSKALSRAIFRSLKIRWSTRRFCFFSRYTSLRVLWKRSTNMLVFARDPTRKQAAHSLVLPTYSFSKYLASGSDMVLIHAMNCCKERLKLASDKSFCKDFSAAYTSAICSLSFKCSLSFRRQLRSTCQLHNSLRSGLENAEIQAL